MAQHAAREPGQGRYLFPDSKLLRFFLDFVDGAFVLAVDDVARFIDRRIHLVGILRQQILHFVEQSHQIHPSSVPRTLSSGADFRHKRPRLPMNLLPCMATPYARCLALRAPKNAVQLGVRHTVGPTKGRKARSVPVPQFVLDELSIQCWGKARGDLVFPGRDGGYLPRPKSSTGWFQSAVKRAGVQKITPHDLRHTCASLAVSAGVNVLALQRMLGIPAQQ